MAAAQRHQHVFAGVEAPAGAAAALRQRRSPSERHGTGRVNFVAKFVMDNGASTDLSLSAAEYDTSPSADYEAWLLLKPTVQATMALPAAAGGPS